MQVTNDVVRKRALVVDDSKSARVILSRMLEKYDIEVNMAESAEAAIEYLKHDRPDAIFMDHLMPGMDGLQAVQLIKSNPQTATIPIMMYTSQAGELYVGQARALGAMGVLPKQVRPVDVSKVLYELHLLPERRTGSQSALMPVELEDEAAVERTSAPAVSSAAAPVANEEWGARVEGAIKQQSADLRRFIVASLDSLAARLASDLRPASPSSPITLIPPPDVPRATRRPRRAPWVAAAVMAALAALFAVLFGLRQEQLAALQAQLANLRSANADLVRSRDQLAASVKDLSAAVAASTVNTTGAGGSASVLGAAGLPRSEPVPYGEVPFDHGRTEALREVLAKLEAQGFHGVLKVTSSTGLFCLAGNTNDGFAPAAGSTPASKCDLVGNPFDESLGGQSRESLSFANLVAGVRQRSGGAISIVLENAGAAHSATPYPARTDALTAGEWNRAAAANNRVEFAAEPAAP